MLSPFNMAPLPLDQGLKPPISSTMSRNSCPHRSSPCFRISQAVLKNSKSLCFPVLTFGISKLLLTTSEFPSWAQTRVSPRHSSSSSFISVGDRAVFSPVTGSESLPDGGLAPQGLFFYICSRSSLLSSRHHLCSSPSVKWAVIHWGEAKGCS